MMRIYSKVAPRQKHHAMVLQVWGVATERTVHRVDEGKKKKGLKKGLKLMSFLSGQVAALALWGFVSEGGMAMPCTRITAVL